MTKAVFYFDYGKQNGAGISQKAIKSNLTQRFKVFKQDSGSKRNTYTVSNNLFVLQFL
jgi:hypothetical protein